MKRSLVLMIVVVLILVAVVALSLALFAMFSGGGATSSTSTSSGSTVTTSPSSELSTSSEPPAPVWDPAADPDYKLMDGAKYNLNFRFYMHNDFVALPVSNAGYKLIVMRQESDSDKLPELMITYGPKEPNLLTYTAAAFESRMHDGGAVNYTCLGIVPFTIGGAEGIKISGRTLKHEQEVLQDKYMVNHGGEVYILHYTYSAEDVGDDRGDKIAMSFEFLD